MSRGNGANSLVELADALARRKFVRKVSASGMSAEQLTIRYAALTTIVQPSPIAPTAADPDDDMVLATAMAANASFIVSGDKQLMKVCVLSGIELLSAADAGVRLSHQT